MSLPTTAVRAASFVLTMVAVGVAYPVLALLGYIGLLIASAVGDLDAGGPLAGLLFLILGAVVGVVCVAIGAPAALAGRALGGAWGVVAAVAVLLVAGGAAALLWSVADLAGQPLVAGAAVALTAAPAALALSLSDVVAGSLARLRPGRRPVVEG